MSKPVRILSIGDDDGLRYSRELLISSDGYETESITSYTAISVPYARSFGIALICRSVQPERAMALVEMLRRYNPEIRILCISPLEKSLESCDADLEIPSGPEAVLEAIQLLCEHDGTRQRVCETSHHG